MSMPAPAGHSKPCCNVPPVVTKGYKAKGTYEEIGGYKTCMFACAESRWDSNRVLKTYALYLPLVH
jgi:hypothetical protein